MPRKFLTKLLPNPEKLHAKLHGKWYLRPFDFLLHDPMLWHIGRRGTCRALALGVFIACLPIPGHMIMAVLGALYWRMNLPVAVAAVWVNNPLTFGPIYYIGYKLGAWLLNPFHPGLVVKEPVTRAWRVPELTHTWNAIKAFLLGCTVEGLVLALVAYIVFDLAWRLSIRGRWKLRKLEREGRN
ncbi:MAG TPA: DUF2062 domain-containing protein [Gammaproteobacteria bacterium]|nr:DUF2062 domain-containing protein [Gammaproteobacteria bacterium]